MAFVLFLLPDAGHDPHGVRPLDAPFDGGSALTMRTGGGVLGWRYARPGPEEGATVFQRAQDRIADLPPDALVDRSEVLLTTARRR